MRSTKHEGVSLPTHLLKVGVVLFGIIFLNTELNKPHFFRTEIIYIHCLQKEVKHMPSRHFSCSCNDTIYSKSKKKNRKSPIFENLTIIYQLTYFRM